MGRLLVAGRGPTASCRFDRHERRDFARHDGRSGRAFRNTHHRHRKRARRYRQYRCAPPARHAHTGPGCPHGLAPARSRGPARKRPRRRCGGARPIAQAGYLAHESQEAGRRPGHYRTGQQDGRSGYQPRAYRFCCQCQSRTAHSPRLYPRLCRNAARRRGRLRPEDGRQVPRHDPARRAEAATSGQRPHVAVSHRSRKARCAENAARSCQSGRAQRARRCR